MAEVRRRGPSPIRGIHHITGLVGSAANDLRFYRDVLGLRLIKKTCNQENPTSGWHFFFGDRLGNPGTIMTNIILEGVPMPKTVEGRGSITDVSYSVSPGSLDYWRERLTAAGCTCTDRPGRFGDPVLHFRDFDGISSELVGCEDARMPGVGRPSRRAPDPRLPPCHARAAHSRADRPVPRRRPRFRGGRHRGKPDTSRGRR